MSAPLLPNTDRQPYPRHGEHAHPRNTSQVIAARIDALRKKWQEETKDLDHPALLERSAAIAAVVAGETDESVTNLSSIVFVARYAGRTMLLTGDARGDYIIDGLERAGFLRNGPAKLDVVKLQHHGSARNTDEDFFSTVLADHYVISANGKYGNPDPWRTPPTN